MSGNMDIWQIILEAGPVVKLVMLLLLVAQFFSWAIILYKWKMLKKIDQENSEWDKYFQQNMGSENFLTEINKISTEYDYSTYNMIFKRGYQEIVRVGSGGEKAGDYIRSHGLEFIDRAIKKGVNESNQIMDHLLSPLASISSVAPFVGLFGTVWGIINSFRGLSAGGGTIEAVAPGIAEALIATAVGLAAAIPANWFFNVFTNRINRINTQMESFSQDFINSIERVVNKKGA